MPGAAERRAVVQVNAFTCQRTIAKATEARTQLQCNEECKDHIFCTGYDFMFSSKTCTFFYGFDETLTLALETRHLMPPLMEDVCTNDIIDDEINGFECVKGDIDVHTASSRDECEDLCNQKKKCTGYRYSIGREECIVYAKKPNESDDFGKRCRRSKRNAPILSISPSDEPNSQPIISIATSDEPSSQLTMNITPSDEPRYQPTMNIAPSDEFSSLPYAQDGGGAECPCIPESVHMTIKTMELDTCKESNGIVGMYFKEYGASFTTDKKGFCTIDGQRWEISRKEVGACKRIMKDACGK
jgi:hypothetical protein